MPAFAKPGLIRRNPPVQVEEGTCQVQRRQPVLIRYQIREVSGSRRTGATLLFLTDPKPLPTNSSSKHPPPHFIFSTHSPNQPLHLSNLSCHSLQNPSALSTIPSQSRGQAALAARGAADLLPAANAANQMPPTSVESKKSALFKCFPQPKHIAEITARLTNICHWPVRISITSALKPDILKPCSCLE